MRIRTRDLKHIIILPAYITPVYWVKSGEQQGLLGGHNMYVRSPLGRLFLEQGHTRYSRQFFSARKTVLEAFTEKSYLPQVSFIENID